MSLINKFENFQDYAFLPIKVPRLYYWYKKQKEAYWSSDEINFEEDRKNFSKLHPDVQFFLKDITTFLIFADGLILENVMFIFKQETGCIKEARNFYALQDQSEVNHGETYSIQGEIIFPDQQDMKDIFTGIFNNLNVISMVNWIVKYMDPSIPLLERIIAFVCIEGILFTSTFVSLYWIKKHPEIKLPGICLANEWIARDEMIHTMFGIELYNHYVEDRGEPHLSPKTIYEIVSSACQCAIGFFENALRFDLIGLSKSDMTKYIKCHADTILDNLKCETLYKETNPFDWMKMLIMPNKTNFFENRVTDYSRPTQQSYQAKFDEDF